MSLLQETTDLATHHNYFLLASVVLIVVHRQTSGNGGDSSRVWERSDNLNLIGFNTEYCVKLDSNTALLNSRNDYVKSPV